MLRRVLAAMRFPNPLACLSCLLGASLALAEDVRTAQAREEIETQLEQLVKIPPPKVEILFEGLDQPQYRIEEAEFLLDGVSVASPSASALNQGGLHPVYSGEVKPGKHSLLSRLVITDSASAMFSKESGYKWKVSAKVDFQAQRGLEVIIRSVPALVAEAKELKEKFKLGHRVDPKMVAAVDDGSMPEAPKKRVELGADAGTAATASAGSAEEKKAARVAAAEEKKRLREEAKAAKLAAAAEAKAARFAAAEEKQRLREEAKAAKLAELAEANAARRSAVQEPRQVAPSAQLEVEPAKATASAEVVPAVAAEAAVPLPVPEVVKPARAAPVLPQTVPAAVVTQNLPWALILAGGAGALALAVFIFTRRRR